jgi:hypothetical protein
MYDWQSKKVVLIAQFDTKVAEGLFAGQISDKFFVFLISHLHQIC